MDKIEVESKRGRRLPERGALQAKSTRVGRRTAIKAGVATVAGIALGTTYVTPNMVSVLVQEASAASGPKAKTPQNKPKPPDKPKPPNNSSASGVETKSTGSPTSPGTAETPHQGDPPQAGAKGVATSDAEPPGAQVRTEAQERANSFVHPSPEGAKAAPGQTGTRSTPPETDPTQSGTTGTAGKVNQGKAAQAPSAGSTPKGNPAADNSVKKAATVDPTAKK